MVYEYCTSSSHTPLQLDPFNYDAKGVAKDLTNGIIRSPGCAKILHVDIFYVVIVLGNYRFADWFEEHYATVLTYPTLYSSTLSFEKFLLILIHIRGESNFSKRIPLSTSTQTILPLVYISIIKASPHHSHAASNSFRPMTRFPCCSFASRGRTGKR